MVEMWHGGSRWDGDPEIRPPKQGRYEAGPGLYLTNQYDRARKYAKGGKVVTRVVLKDNIRWLADARLPYHTLVEFVQSAPRMSAKKAILADLVRCKDREGDLLPVSRLVNLCINHEALAGKAGQHLAAWLTEQGIDADLHSPGHGEDWVVVYNPAIIRRFEVVPGSSIKGDPSFPPVATQLALAARAG